MNSFPGSVLSRAISKWHIVEDHWFVPLFACSGMIHQTISLNKSKWHIVEVKHQCRESIHFFLKHDLIQFQEFSLDSAALLLLVLEGLHPHLTEKEKKIFQLALIYLKNLRCIFISLLKHLDILQLRLVSATCLPISHSCYSLAI